jgi:hypothetical protein
MLRPVRLNDHSAHRSRSLRLVWLAMVVIVAACGSSTRTPPRLAIHIVAVPGAQPVNATWVGNSLVIEQAKGTSPQIFSLWRTRLDGSGLEEIGTPIDPGCKWVNYRFPHGLPDGRLGAVRSCTLRDPQDRVLWLDSFVAFDLSTGAMTTLAPLAPAGGRRDHGGIPEQDFNPPDVTWDPSMTKALIAAGNGICSDLGTLTARGVGTLPVVLNDQGESWSLDAGLHDADTPPCTLGRAASPAWSPDGKQIAFLASPASVGTEGTARQDKPWNLYVMDSVKLQPRRLVTGIA